MPQEEDDIFSDNIPPTQYMANNQVGPTRTTTSVRSSTLDVAHLNIHESRISKHHTSSSQCWEQEHCNT